jgi:hypothetical protein
MNIISILNNKLNLGLYLIIAEIFSSSTPTFEIIELVEEIE